MNNVVLFISRLSGACSRLICGSSSSLLTSVTTWYTDGSVCGLSVPVALDTTGVSVRVLSVVSSVVSSITLLAAFSTVYINNVILSLCCEGIRK